MSLYLLGFLLAAAAAPHHHLNSFEDLLSEGRSDSGIFIETRPTDPSSGTGVQGARLVDDDPCLACFQHDYASSAQQLFALNTTFRPLRQIPASVVVSVAEPSFSPLRRPPRVR